MPSSLEPYICLTFTPSLISRSVMLDESGAPPGCMTFRARRGVKSCVVVAMWVARDSMLLGVEWTQSMGFALVKKDFRVLRIVAGDGGKLGGGGKVVGRP